MNKDAPGLQRSPVPEPIFLRACHSLSTGRVPFWLPSSILSSLPPANHFLAEHGITDILHSPTLIHKTTLSPVERFPLDAVMLFQDGLYPLEAMGRALTPDSFNRLMVESPLRSPREIDLLGTPPAEEHLHPVLTATSSLRESLEEHDLPLIGWSTGPYSLACAAIEGQGPTLYRKTKSLIYHEPAAWKRLMEKLVTVTADFLLKQTKAGAQALVIHDPASGLALPADDYRRHILPYKKQLFQKLAAASVPLIHHTSLPFPLLGEMVHYGDVVSLDSRIPFAFARTELGANQSVQYLVDASLLSAPWRELKAHIDHILDLNAGNPGLLLTTTSPAPDTMDPHRIHQMTDYVHTHSRSDHEHAIEEKQAFPGRHR